MKQNGIVVTGSSSGIGRCVAIELARQAVSRGDGFDTSVLVHYHRNAKGAEETALAIRDVGAQALTIQADLASTDEATRFANETLQRLGGSITWVNNAGADVLTGDVVGWSFDEKLKLLLEVDLMGAITVSRIVGPVLAQRKVDVPSLPTPSMVFIGWDQAPHGMEGDAGMLFGPVKAAVMAFAASLAQTLAPHVRVNTVAPGWIQTAWGISVKGYWNDRAHQQSLMNRWGRPEDVASAVAYLTGRDAEFVTGQVLEVNGGWNRRYGSGTSLDI